MKRVKILTALFSFWILIIIMSASWLFYLLVKNIDLIFSDILFSFVFIIAILSFCLSTFFVLQIILDLKKDIEKVKEKQENVNDMYKYDQLLDPPSMYN